MGAATTNGSGRQPIIEFDRPTQNAESPTGKHPLRHRIDFAVHRKTR